MVNYANIHEICALVEAVMTCWSYYGCLKLVLVERYCGAPKVVRPPDLSLTGASGRRAAGGGGEVQGQGRLQQGAGVCRC